MMLKQVIHNQILKTYMFQSLYASSVSGEYLRSSVKYILKLSILSNIFFIILKLQKQNLPEDKE